MGVGKNRLFVVDSSLIYKILFHICHIFNTYRYRILRKFLIWVELLGTTVMQASEELIP